MLIIHTRLPTRAVLPGIFAHRATPQYALRRPMEAIASANAFAEGRRSAAVKAQGAYKLTKKKTLPKKLGAKRVGDQYVLPGTIIYKQRGTIWHAGENTILGRDHTIHSSIAGYVKYYRDRQMHPDRQYIGVTYERSDVLPYSLQTARKRRLGMTTIPRNSPAAFEMLSPSGIPRRVIRKEGIIDVSSVGDKGDETAAAVAAAESEANTPPDRQDSKITKRESKATRSARRWNAYVRIKRSNRVLHLGNNYSYRESNFQIGRLMGKHKGKTPGTQRYGSRHSVLRHRRKRREAQLLQTRELELQQRKLASEKAQSRKPKGSSPAGSSKKGKKGKAKKAK